MTRPRRRTVLLAASIALAAIAAVFFLRGRAEAVRYVTAAVDRGDIQDVVGATGLLEAVTTVDVGSQVSGTIQELYADFNSQVKKGEVIARLDPSILQARLEQMQANLTSAVAGVTRAKATLEDAKQKYDRAKTLAAENLLAESDLETARSNFQVAAASVQGAQAAVSQAQANVRQAQVDLTHTIIRAPIDGVVIARNVDVGQTVAASLQAPVLFQIANDLARMQVNASIDEADVGRVRAGQKVTFRVDAFPDRTFEGRVEQVRLQPITEQNVVTYNTIISAPNEGGRLMPGMTATVTIVQDERRDALRMPAAALRFRPEGYEDTGRRAGRGPRPGQAEGAQVQDAGTRAPAGEGSQPARSRRRRDAEPGITPAAASTGSASQGTTGADGGGAPRGGPEGDGTARRTRGLAFVLDPAGQPSPVQVRTGLSDGRFVEVLEGVSEGMSVITGVQDPNAAAAPPRPGASPGTTNPFQPGRPQRRAR